MNLKNYYLNTKYWSNMRYYILTLLTVIILLGCTPKKSKVDTSDLDQIDLCCTASDFMRELKLDEAIETLNRAVELDTLSNIPLPYLIIAHSANNEYDEALYYVDLLIEKTSYETARATHLMTKTELLYFNNNFEDFDMQVDMIKSINLELKTNVEISSFLLQKCGVLVMNKDWDEAQNCLRKASSVIKSDYWNTFYSFMIALQSEDYNHAIYAITELNEPYDDYMFTYFISTKRLKSFMKDSEWNQTQTLLCNLLLAQISEIDDYANEIKRSTSPKVTSDFYNEYKSILNTNSKELLEKLL